MTESLQVNSQSSRHSSLPLLVGTQRWNLFIEVQRNRQLHKRITLDMTSDHSGNINGIIIAGTRYDLRIVTISSHGQLGIISRRQNVYGGNLNIDPDNNPSDPFLNLGNEYQVEVNGSFIPSPTEPYPPSNTFSLVFGTLASATRFVRESRNILRCIQNYESGNETGGSESPDDNNAQGEVGGAAAAGGGAEPAVGGGGAEPAAGGGGEQPAAGGGGEEPAAGGGEEEPAAGGSGEEPAAGGGGVAPFQELMMD